MKYRSSTIFLILAVLLIFLVSIAAWFKVFNEMVTDQATKNEMIKEASGFLAQLALIAVLGGAVSLFYSLYSREQEQRRFRLEENNKLRRQLLASVISVRAQVERTRRQFALLPPGEKKDRYRAAIEDLLAARLRLSQVWHDTETWKELYPQTPAVVPEDSLMIKTECSQLLEKLREQQQEDLKKKSTQIHLGLNGMKVFLDGLIEEYEASLPYFQHVDAAAFPEELSKNACCFHTFVTEDKGGALYSEVFLGQYYRPVAQIIRKSIMDSGGEK